MAPSEPTSWHHILGLSPPILFQGWPVWPIGYNRSDGVSLPRWGHKILKVSCLCFCLCLSLWAVSLGGSKLPCYEQPYIEAHVLRNGSLLPTAKLRNRSSNPSQVSRWFNIAQQLDCNPMRNRDLEYPGKLLPYSPPLDIMWNTKRLLF